MQSQTDINAGNNLKISYRQTFLNMRLPFCQEENELLPLDEVQRLQPIVKWAGGKEKELKYILPNIPSFDRYIEPFVGGGSVFMAMKADKFLINDLSSELIALYRNIATSNRDFFAYATDIDTSWSAAGEFFCKNISLVSLFEEYRKQVITCQELKNKIKSFCETHKGDIAEVVGINARLNKVFVKELEANLFRKMCRMEVIEKDKGLLSQKDLQDNIETAIKSALYMTYRYLYNDKSSNEIDDALRCALFLFIRNYAYSGMFRYNDKGDFNVPYGGIAYNSKSLQKKLNYYRSDELLQHFANTAIFNLDFETFLKEVNPTENDFIFLDPPYDSEFSTYAQNKFTRQDQKRLSDFMIDHCKAKWMLIIKNTDYIYNLYNKEGINISMFDKEYLVSFMNRNNKKTTHLMITNY